MQCESTIDCKDGGEYFPQCSRQASVEIDGINLCIQHAGPVAILKLINYGHAKKLDYKKQYDPLCQIPNERKISKWLSINT